MNACVKVLRFFTFLFNFLFWLTGVIVFGLGIWLLFDPSVNFFFASHSTHSGYFGYIERILVLTGVIVMLVGYFGCIGAWKINQCALSFFSIILTLLIVLELASAILLVQKQEHVKHYVESSMYDTIQNRYNSESAFKNAFDKIQEEFQCCGVRMYTDWLSTNWEADGLTSLNVDNKYSAKIEHGIGSYGVIGKNVYGPVPVSCCNNHGKLLYHENCGTSFVQAPLSTYAQFLNTRGCVDVMYDSVHKSLNTVVAICVLLCAIQIVGVVLSVLLCCFPSHHK